MLRYRPLVLALLLTLVPSSLQAQQPLTFTISEFGGVAMPTADLFDETFPDGTVRFSHETSFAVGARLGIWPSSRIGLEAEAAYLGSDVELSDYFPGPGGWVVPIQETQEAGVFVGSVSLVWAMIRPPLEPFALYVSGGVGFISRGGDYFEDFEDTSDIAGVLGLGFKYRVSREVWLRADIKDYISGFKEEKWGEEFDAQLQNDLLVTGGIELSFGGS
jgi:hypothetical protein